MKSRQNDARQNGNKSFKQHNQEETPTLTQNMTFKQVCHNENSKNATNHDGNSIPTNLLNVNTPTTIK